jgi:hypothetical protein
VSKQSYSCNPMIGLMKDVLRVSAPVLFPVCWVSRHRLALDNVSSQWAVAADCCIVNQNVPVARQLVLSSPVQTTEPSVFEVRTDVTLCSPVAETGFLTIAEAESHGAHSAARPCLCVFGLWMVRPRDSVGKHMKLSTPKSRPARGRLATLRF